jgi:3-deoxy-manno-octulosonate cytidylyltransferase (CMP-KDO synthetase)
VIPARFASSRFPGKPLALIAGRSMLEHVWTRAAAATRLDGLLVATDDQRIYEHVLEFGGQAMMTRKDHPSGTDRIGEVANSRLHDYYVNIQGDEPLLSPQAIDQLVKLSLALSVPMSTLVTPMAVQGKPGSYHEPHIVKVVRDIEGFALYFSRSLIPYPRNAAEAAVHKHIGIYMYSRETLLTLCTTPASPLERIEGLEQLRALENGIRVLTVESDYDPVSVDVPQDIQLAEQRLRHREMN